MTSDDIKALLNEKYSDGDKCLIAFEVNEGTGSNSGRRIDALSMELWPSKNYKIVGFEIKVSRSDWLNEMKQPEKSLAISRFCDEFYLVAPYGVLGIDELPKTWGYIQATSDRIFTKIKAPKREAVAIERPFMASFVRSLTKKYSDKKLLQAQVEKVKENLSNQFDDKNAHRIKRLEEQLAESQSIINYFNKQTGLQLNKWNVGNVVHAINSIKGIKKREGYISDIENQNRILEALIEGNKKSVQSLKEINIE